MTTRNDSQSIIKIPDKPNNNKDLIWLSTTYACGGLILNKDNIIIDSAPIFVWMRGKRLTFVLKYLRRKNQLISYRRCDGAGNST